MTRWIILLVALAEPVTYTVRVTATVAPSRHVVCMEAEPSVWHVVGDLTPDGADYRLVPVATR